MKKLSSWTAIAILLFSMIYATLYFGQDDQNNKKQLSGKETNFRVSIK
ncbi:MAG: hypothetical protein HGA37_17815 [Lentimicrobium sp.]|nr:hypothetical protein [Lentimicrobium sp.]